MNTKLYPLLLLVLSALSPISAQVLDMILPPIVADKQQGTNLMQEEFQFVAYPYEGRQINLTNFKRKYPKLQAPDFVTISPPDINFYTEKYVLVGLIPGVPATEDALVMLLAVNYESERVTFWIDTNNDRDFNIGTKVVRLVRGQNPLPIKITSITAHFTDQELSISLPEKIEKKFNRLKKTTKIINSLAVDVFAGAGGGNLNYQFDNLTTGFPSWYDVPLAEKGIGAAISYNFKNIRLGLTGTYLNTSAYTSVLKNQFDVPERRTDPASGREFFVDRVEVRRNADQHTNKKIQYAALIGYRIHPSPSTEIQPFVSYGRTAFLPAEYRARRGGEESVYELGPSTFYQAGLRFEFAVGAKRACFLDLTYLVEFL